MQARSTLLSQTGNIQKCYTGYSMEVNTEFPENTAPSKPAEWLRKPGWLQSSQGSRWGFWRLGRKSILWAGLAGVTSTDQRQQQIKATERLGRNRWSGPGPGRNERQDEGHIIKHHWEMKPELLWKMSETGQISMGKWACVTMFYRGRDWEARSKRIEDRRKVWLQREIGPAHVVR